MDQTQGFDSALRETARSAWSFGLAAVLLAMVAPCGSYITLLPALPLGLVAMSRAKTVLATPNLDPTTEVYARTGQITGLLAAIWAGILLMFAIAIIVLYAGIIAAALATGLQ